MFRLLNPLPLQYAALWPDRNRQCSVKAIQIDSIFSGLLVVFSTGRVSWSRRYIASSYLSVQTSSIEIHMRTTIASTHHIVGCIKIAVVTAGCMSTHI